MEHGMNRREFLGAAAVTSLGAAMSASGVAMPAAPRPFRAKPMDVVRVGFIGLGGMGCNHLLNNLIKIEGVEIRAICDCVPAKVERVQKIFADKGLAKPVGYSKGEYDFKKLCDRDDIDLVYIATPWRWHVPMCVDAMQKGKHACTEVPAAVTIDECWQLVECAEKTQRHCVMMENCCYDRVELTILNMVRKGVFGELIHAECGYLHDLRRTKFSGGGEGLWRREHAIKRNGDLYPTHGLGPVAQCMNINRGNQFDYLVSVSSQSRGLQAYAKKHFAGTPKGSEQYKLGDVVTSTIRTVQGQSIVVQHDTNLPRPYSRDILVQGTKAIVRKYPEAKIHIEGVSPGHNWEDLRKYYGKYEHPLSKAMAEKAKGAGHGGMDFIEDYRLVQCLLIGEPTDMDVYDAAAWSVIGECSERSIAQRSRAIDIPDFTRGRWKERQPLGIITGV